MTPEELEQILRHRGKVQERIDRLEEALRFYAEHVAGCRKIGSEGDAARRTLDRDGGKLARAALGDKQ